MTTRPSPDEFADYYRRYIDAVPDGDILTRLETQRADTVRFLASVTEPQSHHRYAEGKWSVREVIGHLTDCERVFAYRALRISRGDATPLAIFDHDRYVAESGIAARPWDGIREEYEAVRRATILLFRGIAPDRWSLRGTASGNIVSVRAIAWITAGHELHHRGVLRDRYNIT